MTFNPLEEKGIPLDRQLRTWSELASTPFDTDSVHPYTRCRVIAMNGIEVEAIMNSHNAARHLASDAIKGQLAQIRRVEQQQQKAINWLIPAEESVLANTLGYEQVAVDLTSWIARHEPDPYLKQVYEFGVLEDYDHLYRYANLMDLMGERRRAEDVVGDLTEVLPGRPTVFQHRDPADELRRPMTVEAAELQSMLNALTVLSAEQQTMNFYMTVGNRPEDPLARALYLEIAMIEEQHVTHYESVLDPTMSWLTNLALHEYNECWLYWSCMQTESNPRIKRIWELHLAMELEHLRLACRALEAHEDTDPASLFGAGIEAPMMFEPNKRYVREVLERTLQWTGDGQDFVSVEELPEDHRYFAYQRAVHGEGEVPSEAVISRRRTQHGGEYRSSTEGEHPVASLRASGTGEDTVYARARPTPPAE